MEEINFNSIIESILKKWKIMLIVFFCVFVITLGYLVLTFDKRYESEAKILIPKSALTEEYSKIILENDLLKNVANGYKNITVSDLKNSITVDNSEKKVYVIKIIVRHKNNQIAYEIATDVSNAFVSKLKTIYGINNAVVSSKPIVEENNISSQEILVILKKSLMYPALAVCVYIFIAVIIEYLCGKYVSKNGINSLFNNAVLFELPDFEKKYIKNKDKYIAEQYNKLKSRFLYKYSNQEGSIILFSSVSSFDNMLHVTDKLAEMLKKEGKSVYIVKLVKDEKINEKIHEYSKKYDFVFVETYNVISSSYSEEILNYFDKVILIENIGNTNYMKLEKAKELIKYYNIKNVDIIINKNSGIFDIFKYKEFEKRLLEGENS